MRTLRSRSTLLLAAAAWTIWIWATRIWNIVGDAAFKTVHSLLALVSVAFGVALGVLGLRMLREQRSSPGSDREREPAR
jgi:small neutral amino acid transporter SnatA (MarC family)